MVCWLQKKEKFWTAMMVGELHKKLAKVHKKHNVQQRYLKCVV
jgi:hypothetical protein